MTKAIGFMILCAVALPWVLSGCAIHRTEWQPFSSYEPAPPLPEGQSARVIATQQNLFDEFKARIQRTQLPHLTESEKFNAILDGYDWILDSSGVGSRDYVVLGEIWGNGNGFSNWSTMEAHLAKEGALHGGDVVVMYNRATGSMTVPGYASTSFSSYGAFTTYRPPMQVSYPVMNAWVFKHVRDFDRLFRQGLRRLSAVQLAAFTVVPMPRPLESESLEAFVHRVMVPLIEKHLGANPE